MLVNQESYKRGASLQNTVGPQFRPRFEGPLSAQAGPSSCYDVAPTHTHILPARQSHRTMPSGEEGDASLLQMSGAGSLMGTSGAGAKNGKLLPFLSVLTGGAATLRGSP